MGKTRSQKDQKFSEILADAFKESVKETGIYLIATIIFIIFCWICVYA